MSKDTKIQWTDGTVNPTMGCDGCELHNASRKSCYAGVLHARYGGAPGFAPTFDQVTMFPGRMAEAAKWSDLTGKPRKGKPWLDGQPRMIFVSDMSDALSKVVPFEYLKAEIIDVVSTEAGKRHVWQWLTKRPKRMAEFSAWLLDQGVSWPTNLWAGTSITDQRSTVRIDGLMEVGDRNTIRFLSVEPLVGLVDLNPWLPLPPRDRCRYFEGVASLVASGMVYPRLPKIDFAIVGGESGPDARLCDLDWILSVLNSCQYAGVPVFIKQLGSVWAKANKAKDGHGGDWDEWPSDLRVREFPKVAEVAR